MAEIDKLWQCNRCKNHYPLTECGRMVWESGYEECICFNCNPRFQEVVALMIDIFKEFETTKEFPDDLVSLLETDPVFA